jgi:hypothetical protein
MWSRIAGLLLCAVASTGCAAVVYVPRAIDLLSEGPSAPSGFEYYRHDGHTVGGEPFRIRHFVDPDARLRFVVALVGGKLFSSRSADVTRDMEAARAMFVAAGGRSGSDAQRLFGPPHATTRFEDVHVLWYVRERDEVFALVFRQDRYVTGFRLDRREMERMLDKPSPYAQGPSTLWTNRNELTAAR